MTLIVSLRIPDGIVLAGDSLATLMSGNVIQGDVDVVCPKCNHQHTTTAKLQGAAVPATSLSYAQKIFPFLDTYGIGTSGAAQLGGKTIYFAVRQLEQQVRAMPEVNQPKNASEVANRIAEHAKALLHAEAVAMGIDPATLDPNVVSFQVVGYDGDSAKAILITVGNDIVITPHEGPGASVIGRLEIVNALWNLTGNPQQDTPVFELFSLQDAIGYSEFLISATGSYQKFLRAIPTVGGEIDVALITPFDRFRWIRQKSLYARIAGGHHG